MFIIKSLPDISKWNTYNVTKMSGLFYECSSLKYLPDISKWNTNNVKNISEMFSGCINLSFLPNIYKFEFFHLLLMKIYFIIVFL